MVWEYKVPATVDRGAVKNFIDGDNNQVFLSYRYGPDFPGLAGRDLTPGPKLTE